MSGHSETKRKPMSILPFLLMVLLLMLLPYLGAVLMWSWRSLLVCTGLLGSPLAAVWLIEWWESHLPEYDPGAGQAFGLLLFGSLTIGLVWGVVVRILSLWWIRTNGTSEIRGAKIHTAAFFCLTAALAIFFYRPL
jgi:hypothetical protein